VTHVNLLILITAAVLAIRAYASPAPQDTSAPIVPGAAQSEAIAGSSQPQPASCESLLSSVPFAETFKRLKQVCEKAKQLTECESVQKTPIYHFEFEGTAAKAGQKVQNILVFSVVHGDEDQSGSVALSWLNRLQDIAPRNRWRIIPVLNPDGWKLKTRTNANGIDINRNFPSKDWDALALKYWKSKADSNPRRFPGKAAASEPETRCAMAHIEEFKPDFIISIHTPLGVLDFDGPPVKMPKFQPLPWVNLGNFPGSLGRYMWVDRNVPVLTVELKAQSLAAKSLEEFDKLQDISGTVAVQAEKAKSNKR
jgi:protein MpaA